MKLIFNFTQPKSLNIMSIGYTPDKLPVVYDDSESQLYAVGNGLKPINVGGGSSSYLVYKFGISQVGTGAPTIHILQNTIGNIVWSRNSIGFYEGTLTGAFTENKTWIANMDNLRTAMYPISFSGINKEAYTFYWASTSTIAIQIFDSTFNNVDLSTLFGDNNILWLPEVNVFP